MKEINNGLEKEIELIQGCINRMAQNSFAIKGWLIALVTAVFALMIEKVARWFLCLVIFMATCCLWYLDAYYLQLERLYRWKYEWVINMRAKNDVYLYDLNPENTGMWLPDNKGNQRRKPCVLRLMFTKSVFPLYCVVMVVTFVIFVGSILSHIFTAPI